MICFLIIFYPKYLGLLFFLLFIIIQFLIKNVPALSQVFAPKSFRETLVLFYQKVSTRGFRPATDNE